MTVHEIQEEILRLKKEKDICILAHAYQKQSILEIADYTGDSYGLSVQAAKTSNQGVIMCGVRFMAETLQDLITGQEGMVGQPHGRMSYGRAAWS